MTLVKGILRVLFVLLMQSAIWSICVCKPVKKEELSPLDDDLFDPYSSQRPIWPPTFRPPMVWPTWNPMPWTLPPHNFKNNSNTSGIPTGLRVLIFILIGIAGLIAGICKYYICHTNSSGSTNQSSAVEHSPPEGLSPTNLDRNSPQNQYRVMPPYAGASSYSLSRNTQQLLFGTLPTDAGALNAYDVTDKPPSYSEVVTSDLSGEASKFPDVPMTAPYESPPPKYEKEHLPKF